MTSFVSYDDWGAPTMKAILRMGERELDLVTEYTGHPYDEVLGVYFAEARMYDAGDRRFMAEDQIAGNCINAKSLVAYIFVTDNPLKYVDLNGLVLTTYEGEGGKKQNTNSVTVTFLNVPYTVEVHSVVDNTLYFTAAQLAPILANSRHSEYISYPDALLTLSDFVWLINASVPGYKGGPIDAGYFYVLSCGAIKAVAFTEDYVHLMAERFRDGQETDNDIAILMRLVTSHSGSAITGLAVNRMYEDFLFLSDPANPKEITFKQLQSALADWKSQGGFFPEYSDSSLHAYEWELYFAWIASRSVMTVDEYYGTMVAFSIIEFAYRVPEMIATAKDLSSIVRSFRNGRASNNLPNPYAGNNFNGNRNKDLDFMNNKGSSLQKHFTDHKDEFGFKTESEYLNAARNFLDGAPTSTTQSFVSRGGTYFRYDTATNEFGIINEYGGISTYFKPNSGISYWHEQISNFAP